MESRHVRLLAIFFMLTCIVFGVGCYFFVIFHWSHLWSILFICLFFFFALVSPAICFGYDTDPPELTNINMTPQSYLNCRDLGYVASAIFMLLTYLMPVIGWWSTWGTHPPYMGVMTIFAGNTTIIWAFAIWLRIFVLSVKT